MLTVWNRSRVRISVVSRLNEFISILVNLYFVDRENNFNLKTYTIFFHLYTMELGVLSLGDYVTPFVLYVIRIF